MTRAAVATARRGRRRPVSWGLAAAALLVVGAVSLPLVYLVVRAAEGGPEAWAVLARPGTLAVVGRTVVLVAAVAASTTVIGVAMAWLVVRTDLPGRRAWAVAAALPLVVPSYVAALAVIAALGPGSALVRVVEGLPGIERAPSVFGFPGSFVALTFATYPYVYLLTAAALRRADPALEEASRSLGRSSAATFRAVTLPVLRPSIGAGALLAALYALSDFGVVSLMRHDVLTRVIFQQYRTLFDRTPAAVLGLLLVVLTAVVLLLEARVRGRGSGFGASATGRPASTVALGRWRWPALALSSGVVGLGLVVPVGVLAYWALRGATGVEWADVLAPAARSLLAGGLAATAAVICALPVALLAARTPARWTRGLERISFAANALPGVVIALTLVFFATRYAGAIYQTLILLLFAYVVRFLPQAVAGAGSALANIGPELEEAARALGRGPRAAFAAVTLPLLAPGLLASAALVFLSTMKELPATLLLRPIGFDTLATEVWTETAVSAYAGAALPALALIALSAPVVLRLVARPDGARDRQVTGAPA